MDENQDWTMANGHGGARPGGGRPLGSLNKRSLEFRAKLDEACAARDFDLIGALVEVAADPQHEDCMASRKLLVDYGYPKLKAVEAEVRDPTKLLMVDPTEEPEDPLA